MNKFSACILGAVLGITSNLVFADDFQVTFEGITVISKGSGCGDNILVQEHFKSSEPLDQNNVVIAHGGDATEAPTLAKPGMSTVFMVSAQGGWIYQYCASMAHKWNYKVKFVDLANNKQSNTLKIFVDASKAKVVR